MTLVLFLDKSTIKQIETITGAMIDQMNFQHKKAYDDLLAKRESMISLGRYLSQIGSRRWS